MSESNAELTKTVNKQQDPRRRWYRPDGMSISTDSASDRADMDSLYVIRLREDKVDDLARQFRKE